MHRRPAAAITVSISVKNRGRHGHGVREVAQTQVGHRRLTVGLLAYGLAVAALTIVLTSFAAPDRWLVMQSREQEYAASLQVLKEGGPPLLAHADAPGVYRIPGEDYAPVGVTDDQGAHLYVPVIANLLGIDDPLEALTILYLALFAVPIALYPLIFHRLFRSVPCAILAPLALGLLTIGIAGDWFGAGYDIYWILAWAVLGLLPPLLLIDLRWPRGSVALILGIAVAASFATSIRSNAGLPIVLSAALVILAHKQWSLPRRGGAIALIAVAYLSISSFAFWAVREQRNDWVGSARFEDRASLSSHPIWHNAYIGLGYFPNDYGIFYRDDVAADTVERLEPEAGYITPEYERVLRDRYVDVVRDQPDFYLLNLAGKTIVAGGQNALWLVPIAILAPFALTLGPRAPMMRRFALLLAPALLVGAVPALATVPLRAYEFGLMAALWLSLILLGSWLAVEVAGWVRGGTWPEVSYLWTRADARRPAVWAVTGAVLCVALLVPSRTLERKANDWQLEHGGYPISQSTSPAPAMPRQA